jgi:hypothetical protein
MRSVFSIFIVNLFREGENAFFTHLIWVNARRWLVGAPGRGHDQAGDQQDDDIRSLVFEAPAFDKPIEILGAAIVTLDVASDRSHANLAVRLCNGHRSAKALRGSYDILNLPAPLTIGDR